MKLKYLLSCGLLLILQACAWVQLTPEGEKVRLLEAHEVTKCELLGSTTATTTSRLVGVPRHQNAIQDELQSLARNSASKMGGDTIVAEGDLEEGKQSFKVYRCVPH
jgi:hypothetical protein